MPKIKLIIKDPSLDFNPDLEVGIPVLLENFLFADEMPNARFHENENPNFPIFIIKSKLQYLTQKVEAEAHLNL